MTEQQYMVSITSIIVYISNLVERFYAKAPRAPTDLPRGANRISKIF